MSNKSLSYFCFWLTLFLQPGCRNSTDQPSSGDATDANSGRPLVCVTSYVLASFVTEVCSDQVDLRLLIPDGTSGSKWKPSLDDIRVLQSADLTITSGAGYEPWISKLSLPKSRLVDSSAGYSAQLIAIPEVLTHQHGPKGNAADLPTACLTWLDPELAIAQLRVVERQLTLLLPDSAAQIAQRTSLLVNELDAVNNRLQKLADRSSTQSIVAISDPPTSFYYLARRLGWKTVDRSFLDSTKGTDPGGDSPVSTTIGLIQQSNTASLDSDLRNQITTAGISVIEIDSCETAANGNSTVAKRMLENLDRIEQTISSLKN